MNTEMTLWALLILSLASAVIAAKMSAHIWHLIRWNLGKGATLWLGLTQIVNVALFCWLAYITGWWQFAAMSVGGFLINKASASAKPDVAAEWSKR